LVTSYGRPAGEALAGAVARAKGGRPLAPVTVVVASNLVGLTARRLLASGVLGGSGVANVSFVTPFRLAELLAADLAADRRPITNPMLGAAVRRALAEAPGPFAGVAGHAATETAVATLYGELSHCSAATLDRLEARGGTVAGAVGVFRAVTARLAGFTGEDELVRAAAERDDLAEAAAALGHVVWYLPEPVTPALSGLVAAVLAAVPAMLIVGVTGAADADEAVLATCRRAGIEVPAADVNRVEPPTGDAIISVTDADEEVRAVVRRIAGLAEAGVPLHRIGVFHPVSDPYVHTLEQQLAAAGIPASGPRRERLADSVAGRFLLGALALPDERWRRDRVMALIASGPVRPGDGARAGVTASWERISRDAGVVGGLADWHAKLSAFVARRDHELAETDPVTQPGRTAYLRGDRDDALALAGFVTALARRVDAVETAAGWAGKTASAAALLTHLLGNTNQRKGWPPEELDAADRVEAALVRLAALDELEPDPSAASFRRALTAELDVSRGRHGRFGDGVVYGPLTGAAGHDLDAVFVVGLTEGQCPAPRRDDALLPDSARRDAAEGELRSTAARLGDQHRAFLAALAAAPPGRRYLTFPRGDLRGGRHQLPSRWLLETASARAGRKIYSTDFAALPAPVVDVVASHRAGVTAGGPRASLLDWDLAALSACATAGGDPAGHPVAAESARSFSCVAARRSPDLTPWDGNLAGLPVPSPASGDILSASRLEAWAACGFRYFLGSVLRLGGREDPERILELGHTDRGSAVHEILERFFTEQIAAGPPDPSTPWSPAQRERLAAIADEVFDQLEATGKTGRRLHWQLQRRELAILLDEFLSTDDDYRAQHQATPVRAEQPFGAAGEPPVEIELADGRVVRFRGYADRVDCTPTGYHLVTDYKTGKGDKYGKFDEDPTQAGTTLQLGLYSEAAVQLLGATSAQAHFWMVNSEAASPHIGYQWGPEQRERFVEVVGAIVDGIDRGVFAATPGEWDSWRGTHATCRYCDFNELCPVDRGEFAELKATAPELEVRSVLTGTAGEAGEDT
jgi:RecB family exonuclease